LNSGSQRLTTLEWAELYVSLGFSVIPLWPRSKMAVCKWQKYQHMKPSTNQLKNWWGKHPDWGIAIITGKLSGVFVLDPDDINSMAEVEKRGRKETVSAETSRAWHDYFKYPDFKVPSKKGRSEDWPFEHADLQSDGHYVVAPPSIHPTGKEYAWIRSPLDCDIAEAPQWLLDLLKPISVSDNKNSPSIAQGNYRSEDREIESDQFGEMLPNGNIDLIVEEYVRRAIIGNRNKLGFDFARRLRDAFWTKTHAREAMLLYQFKVPQAKGNRYTQGEALMSLNEAYKVQPRSYKTSHSAEFLIRLLDAITTSKDLTKNEKLILTILVNRDRDQGKEIFPSYETLKSEASLSKGSMARGIHSLNDKGWLQIEKIPVSSGEKGRYRHKYRILLPGNTEQPETQREETNDSLKQIKPNTNAGSVTMVSTNRPKDSSQNLGKNKGNLKMEREIKANINANRFAKSHKPVTVPNSDDQLIHTLKVVSKKFGRSRQTIMSWVNAGQLPCVRIKRNSVYFTQQQLDDFIERHIEVHSPLKVPKI